MINQTPGGYDKFVVDANATIPNKMTEPMACMPQNEERYEVTESSIYGDKTRDDETQGGAY